MKKLILKCKRGNRNLMQNQKGIATSNSIDLLSLIKEQVGQTGFFIWRLKRREHSVIYTRVSSTGPSNNEEELAKPD